ncbi:MAG: hypothetical protein ACTSW4_07935 [Candidatus Ranarchaeia archaeon]
MVVSPTSPDFSGLWVIVKESGLPVITIQPEDKAQKDPLLFAGLMIAIRNMISTFKIGHLNSFSTDTHVILSETSDHIVTVLAVSKTCDAEMWNPLLSEIHSEMEQIYKKIQQDSLYLETNEYADVKLRTRKKIHEYCRRLIESQSNRAKTEITPSKKAKQARSKLEDTGLW